MEVKAGSSSLTFSLGSPSETKAGYFPVKPLTANLTVTNKNGVVHTLKTPIEDAKARDHIILKYKSGDAEQGSSGINVTIDESTKTYTYEITVNLKEVAAGLDATSVNAWAKFAYLEGTATVKGMELDNSLVKLQYKEADASDWIPLDAVMKEDVYKATATALTPATSYQYRMYYKNGDTEFVSDTIAFTTEEEEALYNGDFDNWYQASNVWYAVAEADYNDGNAFWDSGNKGASLMKKNPTSPEESVVHTPGGKSAKLQSQYVGIGGALGAFAAGNLYSGHFVKTIGMSGAEIQFGSEFTGRPTQLHGYFQYTAGTVDYYGDSTPSDALVKEGGTDMNSIYIALSDADAPYTVNTKEGTFVDFDNDPNIIAYGELPVSECVTTSGWKEFTIDLVYRDLTRKPKYIILVCSASKYGDYFTGSSGSVMYIDDFELVYDGEPKTEE